MIKTYVDAGVLIEAYRTISPLAGPALALLSDPNREFVTSEFVRLEVLPKPTYYGRVATVAWLRSRGYGRVATVAWLRSRGYGRVATVAFYNRYFAAAHKRVNITMRLAGLALKRADAFGLNAVDALHVAAAEANGAAELVTTERPTSPLLRVTSIPVVSLYP